MKSIRCTLYLTTSLALFYSVSSINQTNIFEFERAEMEVMPNTGWKRVKFIAKKLSPTAVNFEVELSLNRTYQTLFAHIEAYRQFSSNEYRKFLFDLWEEVCKVTEEGDGNVFLKIVKRIIAGNNNIFQECPYKPGKYFLTLKRMSINRLNFGQILPSGRYRIEMTFTDGFKGTTLIIFKMYLNISDRRIEQF